MTIFQGGGKLDYPGETLAKPWIKSRTNKKLIPQMIPGRNIKPGPQWWRSALTTVQSLLRHPYSPTLNY